MIKIAPSILSANFAELGNAVKNTEQWGADYVHVDIMDGTFTPTFTFGPAMVKALRKYTKIPFDVHLMQENPMRWIDAFADAGADILTIHVEAEKHLHRALQMIKNRNIRTGVSLNPATPLSTLDYILEEVDLILIMGVNPGAGGQTFIESSLKKISELKKEIDLKGLSIEIAVDGGINVETAKLCIEAGANVLISGNTIFGADDPKEMVRKLRGGN